MLTLTTASPHPVSHVLFHPDGATFAVAQPNSGVTLVDRTGAVVRVIAVPRVAGYSSIIFVKNGARLVAASPRGVTVCDTASGTLIDQHGWHLLRGAVLTEHEAGVLAVTESGAYDLQLGAAAPGKYPLQKMLATWRPLPGRARVVAVLPGGRWAVGVYGRVKPSLVDITTGRVAYSLNLPYRIENTYGGELPAVAFAPTGERFAFCNGVTLTVFDTPRAEHDPGPDEDDDPDPSLVQRATTATAPKPRAIVEPVFTLDRPYGVARDRTIPPFAFTPDGRGLLIRRPRNRVQLWDVSTATQTREWSWRLDSVTCLAVAPDGLTAVAGARHGRVVMWDLE